MREVSAPKKGAFILLTVFMASSVCIVACELLLRLVPIPGVNFAALKYNDIVGRDYYPGSVVTYRNDRADYVRRWVNHWGYLDVEHDLTGSRDVYRIGFFGDSFTEAKQVPTDSTFCRRIETFLQGYNVECLAFGFSGRGTVHSYLLAGREMTRFELDMVIYVFYDNDIGDQIEAIKQDPNLPYVRFENGTITVDKSFRQRHAFRKSWPHRLYQFLQARSLFLQTIRNRAQLLLEHGIRMHVANDNRRMRTILPTGLPDQNDPPSTWPDSLRSYAATLASAMIAKWHQEVLARNKQFAIIYIPLKKEWKKPSQEQDSWKPWLEDMCRQHEIELVDPTPRFWIGDSLGQELYYDHLTSQGHRALARAFAQWFETQTL